MTKNIHMNAHDTTTRKKANKLSFKLLNVFIYTVTCYVNWAPSITFIGLFLLICCLRFLFFFEWTKKNFIFIYFFNHMHIFYCYYIQFSISDEFVTHIPFLRIILHIHFNGSIYSWMKFFFELGHFILGGPRFE